MVYTSLAATVTLNLKKAPNAQVQSRHSSVRGYCSPAKPPASSCTPLYYTRPAIPLLSFCTSMLATFEASRSSMFRKFAAAPSLGRSLFAAEPIALLTFLISESMVFSSFLNALIASPIFPQRESKVDRSPLSRSLSARVYSFLRKYQEAKLQIPSLQHDQGFSIADISASAERCTYTSSLVGFGPVTGRTISQPFVTNSIFCCIATLADVLAATSLDTIAVE